MLEYRDFPLFLKNASYYYIPELFPVYVPYGTFHVGKTQTQNTPTKNKERKRKTQKMG